MKNDRLVRLARVVRNAIKSANELEQLIVSQRGKNFLVSLARRFHASELYVEIMIYYVKRNGTGEGRRFRV